MTDAGYLRVPRRVRRELERDPLALAVFMLVLDRARYPGGDHGAHGSIAGLSGGQCVLGHHEVARLLGSTRQKIRTAIDNLRNNQLVTTKSTSRGTIVTVTGHAGMIEPPTVGQPADQPADQPANQPLTSKRSLSREGDLGISDHGSPPGRDHHHHDHHLGKPPPKSARLVMVDGAVLSPEDAARAERLSRLSGRG